MENIKEIKQELNKLLNDIESRSTEQDILYLKEIHEEEINLLYEKIKKLENGRN